MSPFLTAPPHTPTTQPGQVVGDLRNLGLYDARFHSTSWGATPQDYRVLPDKIILCRQVKLHVFVSSVPLTE